MKGFRKIQRMKNVCKDLEIYKESCISGTENVPKKSSKVDDKDPPYKNKRVNR